MAKGRDLPRYVLRRKRDGVLLFRKRFGASIFEAKLETQFPEGQAIPFALHQEVERLLSAPTPVKPGSTVSSVIDHYLAHRKYRDRKPRTRKDYDKRIAFFREKLSHLEPKNIERRHVISWLDAWAKNTSPHEANYRLRVLSILLEHAIDMGLLKTGGNPAKGVPQVQYEKAERQPWPDELVKAFRSTADGRTLLLFELLIGTGQRIGDVLKMRWGDIDGDGINVKQGKTGKALWLPMTPQLRAQIAKTTPRSIFILTNQNAMGAWSYRGASAATMKIRKEIGALEYDIHSLRYTTAADLLTSGASDDVISAITGQSPEMVRHYTKGTRQKVRALQAKDIRN